MTTTYQPRVVTYSRFSSNNQREESIDAQQRAIYKYIAEKGYRPVGDYVDEALTGTNTNRPGFNQMLVEASKGLFDIVIVHKRDRFSRNLYDALNTERQLAIHGVKIESVIGKFDDSPEGKFQQHIQLSVDQYYSANLAREVMKGLKENAYNAKHNGGTPPLGYDVNPLDNTYMINEYEAECVRIIFKKFLEGWSYRELANYLNLLGYKTKIGRSFKATSSFYDLLTNPKYKGEYVFNRSVQKPKQPGMKRSHRKNKDESEIIRVKGGVPAIVDEKTFDKVQELFASRQRTKGQKKAKEVYLLSGLVYCSECGSKYHANARIGGRNKEKYVSYRCSKRKAFENKCTCKEINRTLLDEFILNQLFTVVLKEENVEQLHEKVNQLMQERLSQQNNDLPQLKKQLKTIDTQITNLVKAIAAGGLQGLETITVELHRLEQDKLALTERIEEQTQQEETVQITIGQIKEAIVGAKEHVLKHDNQMIKHILSKFINKINISNEAIEVEYNLGGFFVDVKRGELIEKLMYRKDCIYKGLTLNVAV